MEPNSTSKKKVFVYLGIGIGVAALAGGAWYFLRKPAELNNNDLPAEKEDTPEVPVKTGSTTTNTSAIHASAAGTFPLKKGSKGELVKQLQQALNTNYKTALLVDGDFGSKTAAALLSKNFPAVVDALTFAKIVAGGTVPAPTVNPTTDIKQTEDKTLSTKEAVSLASNLKKAAESRNAFAVVEQIKKIGNVDNYMAVNEVFKNFSTNGVRQTIVNASLSAFPEAGTKDFVREALKDIGLKYNAAADKWALAGTGRRLITHSPTILKNGEGYSYEVPGQTLLGLELGKAKGLSAFRSFDNQIMYVPTHHVRYI